jgi:hypothetical protein
MERYLQAILVRLLVEREKYIVNDADTREENRRMLQGSMHHMLLSALGTASDFNLKPSEIKPDLNSKLYWEQLGLRVNNTPTTLLRCGECAALMIHAIRTDRNRPALTLRVIEMGTAKIDGHFFVVAGAASNYGFPISGNKSLTENWGNNVYTLDLWGFATECANALVTYPGSRPFINRGSNALTPRAFWNIGE